MAERNPIETLAGISDAPQQPDPEFAARLLDDLLIDLVSEQIDRVGEVAAVELRVIDAPQTAHVPAIDLLTGANERTENMTRNRLVGGVLALAATIALIVGGVLLIDDDNDDVETAQPAVTTSAPPTTPSESVFGSAEALEIANVYFAANSAGDFAALRALFVPDAAFTGPFGIAVDESLFAWNAVQGTTVSPPDCTAVDGAVRGTMTVSCRAFNHDALVQAVDGPPVPIQLTLTITPEGIVEESGSFGQPNFKTVGDPFDGWMRETHSEDAGVVGFGRWATIEEAEQNGILTVQYAAEWAAYLEANGCEYDDDC
jgi:hypothetical protein